MIIAGLRLLPLLVLTLFGLGPAAVTTAERETVLEVAGRSSEYATLAADGNVVAVAWAASRPSTGTDIFAAVSGDGGLSFSAPVRVNRTVGEAQVNGEQPPRIVLVPRRHAPVDVVVVWTAKAAAGTRLLSARSGDGGRTFGPTQTVTGSDAAGNRGWQSIAVDAGGRVQLLWLDHREAVPASGAAHQHGAPSTPSAAAAAERTTRAQSSQLYFGSLDGPAPRSLARGVCYCCKTALTVARGITYAAWRHVYPGSRRDIALTLSRDGGRTFSAPVRVSEDNWQLDGCPENGPSLAVDNGGRAHVVWPTLVQDGGRQSLRLFHAMTSDGSTFTRRQPLPVGGPAYHPQTAVAPDGSLLVVWDEVVGGARQVKFARGHAQHGAAPRFDARLLSAPGAPGLYPAIAVTPAASVIAWTSRLGDRSRITIARVAH